MPITYGSIKQLSSQLLHATESIVYTAPSTGSTEICTIWLHNSTAANNVVKVYFPFTATQPTGAFSSSLALERLSEFMTGSYTLEVSPKVPFVLNGATSDKITMRSTFSGSVNVLIYGREGNGTA